MKILYVAHRIPYPPDKGDKIRGWHFLRCLAKRGHEIDLACLVDDEADLEPSRKLALQTVCRRVSLAWRPRHVAKLAALTAVVRGVAASLPFFHDTKLARTLSEWLETERYDAAIAHSAPMTQYIPERAGMTRVADLCDVDSEKWRQYAERGSGVWKWIHAREARLLRRHEIQLARRWDALVVASRPEASIFRSFCTEGNLAVVGNGVDGEFFAPRGTMAKSRSVLFMGAMDYLPNVEGVQWFVREVWPLIRAEMPDARFTIVGPRATAEVKALHAPAGGIDVKGYVDDVRDALAASAVSIAPLHIARGVQNKVLEAMAFGLPVVATRAAYEGISADAGTDLLVADAPAGFARAVIELLKDASLRVAIGQRARRAVLEGHTWDAHTARLEALCRDPRQPHFVPSEAWVPA